MLSKTHVAGFKKRIRKKYRYPNILDVYLTPKERRRNYKYCRDAYGMNFNKMPSHPRRVRKGQFNRS